MREVHRVLPDHLVLSEKQGRGQPQELRPQGLQARGIRAKLTKGDIEDIDIIIINMLYIHQEVLDCSPLRGPGVRCRGVLGELGLREDPRHSGPGRVGQLGLGLGQGELDT